jgi:hypothetical protein
MLVSNSDGEGGTEAIVSDLEDEDERAISVAVVDTEDSEDAQTCNILAKQYYYTTMG